MDYFDFSKIGIGKDKIVGGRVHYSYVGKCILRERRIKSVNRNGWKGNR